MDATHHSGVDTFHTFLTSSLPVVACHDATGAGSEPSTRPHIHTFRTSHASRRGMPRRYGCRVRIFQASTHPHFPYFPFFPSWHATTLRVPGPNLPSVHTSTLSTLSILPTLPILPILLVPACHDATGAGSSTLPHIHTSTVPKLPFTQSARACVGRGRGGNGRRWRG